MIRIPVDETEGLRGGDRGGSHSRPLEVCDDSVQIGEASTDWKREEYTDKKTGQKMIGMTRT